MAAGGDIMPFLAMVLVQMGYAGMNITSKLAMESGMSPFVLVAYRQVVATISIIPFAYWLEWKTRPKITVPVLVQAFFCSITGVTMNQVFYFVGLKNSTPTIACALSNILPAVTFVLAVIFRQESVGIKRKAGQAKVLGTTMCVGGAMLLSFYHGHIIGISEPSIHWKYAEKMRNKDSGNQGNLILGPFMLLASCVGCAAWFVIQARMSKNFPAPYISTGLMCLMGSIQCGIIAIFTDHKISAWPLTSTIRLTATLYAGIVGSALAVCLTSWSIQRKGPLYVSIFSPLLLVMVALLSWALLEEKLYIGTAVGSVLIVGGLYAVIWGSDRERKLQNTIEETETMKPQEVMKMERKEKDDLESQTFSMAISISCYNNLDSSEMKDYEKHG